MISRTIASFLPSQPSCVSEHFILANVSGWPDWPRRGIFGQMASSLRMLLKIVSLPPKLHLAVPVNKRSALGTPREGGQKFLQI
jgi:hypothetical protein